MTQGEARILPEPEREKLLKIIAAQRDFLQAYRKGKYELYSMSPEVRDAAIKCLPCSEGPLDRAERDALETRTPAIADGVGVYYEPLNGRKAKPNEKVVACVERTGTPPQAATDEGV